MGEPDEFAPLDDMGGWNTDEKCPYPDCAKSIGELYEHIRANGSRETFDCPHCERPIDGEGWLQYILQRPR